MCFSYMKPTFKNVYACVFSCLGAHVCVCEGGTYIVHMCMCQRWMWVSFFEPCVTARGCPGTHSVEQVGLKLRDPPLLPRLSAGIKGICHHAMLGCLWFYCLLTYIMESHLNSQLLASTNVALGSAVPTFWALELRQAMASMPASLAWMLEILTLLFLLVCFFPAQETNFWVRFL